MKLRDRLFIGVVLFAVLSGACLWARYSLTSEYFDFFGVLLLCIILYFVFYISFYQLKLTSYWTKQVDGAIALFTGIGTLVFAMNMSNKIDEEQPSFWVVNGNNWLTDVFATILALLIVYVVASWIFRQWKGIQTLKRDKSIAELALLKNQVNPHFFFNTLNVLFSLIKTDPDTAQDYVLKLSEMMRFTIYKGKEELVTLKEEINYLNNFIELQTARYHKNVDVNFVHNVDDPETKIPPLLFIILLENAFKHGVENLIDDAFIHLELKDSDEGIHFSVRNNYDPEISTEGAGIGLNNLKDRLKLLYPDTHQFSITVEKNVFVTKLEILK